MLVWGVLVSSVDNVVKPRFMQSGLDVPPLVGLLSLVVWAYLLGPIGTLLAVPLTIAVKRVLEDADVTVPGLSKSTP
jgi:predicted PurR-regulated permease PerM